MHDPPPGVTAESWRGCRCRRAGRRRWCRRRSAPPGGRGFVAAV